MVILIRTTLLKLKWQTQENDIATKRDKKYAFTFLEDSNKLQLSIINLQLIKNQWLVNYRNKIVHDF